MTLYKKSSKNTSGLNVDNVGVTPSGISFNRSGPRKTVSSAWSARWPNSAVPRKPLNSVPGSGNGKKNGGAWCVYVTIARAKYTFNASFVFMPSTPNSISLEKSSIPQWCCQASVHMACILQSMHTQYGRANKHLWRCVHCRRYLMDSRDEDVFHIGINDVDSFDSDDNEEIEHVHRINEVPPDQPLLRTYPIPDRPYVRDEGQ